MAGVPDLSKLRAYSLPIALTLVSVAIASAGEGGRAVFRYSRIDVYGGELWRLLSAHFTHLSVGHLVLNLIGLWLIAWLFADVGPRRQWSGAGTAVLAMGAGFMILEPNLDWYVGLSGLLHGLVAAALAAHYRKHPMESALMGLGLLAKLAWENLFGPLPFTAAAAGGPVIVAAHLYGTLGGTAFAVFDARLFRAAEPSDP